MDQVVTAIGVGVWTFAVTNVDDFVILTTLFVTVDRGGPSRRQIVEGQYLGIGGLVATSLVAALGLSFVPIRWVGLLGIVPLSLGVRGLVHALRRSADHDATWVLAVRGRSGVAALTVASGGDNVSVYTFLFRRAGPAAIGVYLAVFALLVGVWCLAAAVAAGRGPLIAGVERVGHWLVPIVYIVIGVRIVVTSGLLTG